MSDLKTIIKNQTIDEFCGLPQGSFEKFLEEQTAENRAMEEKRADRIREALKNRVLNANKPVAKTFSEELEERTEHIFGGARIRISVDGSQNYTAFSVAKAPECSEDWLEIFKELVRAMEAEDMPDWDVLGEYNPRNL